MNKKHNTYRYLHEIRSITISLVFMQMLLCIRGNETEATYQALINDGKLVDAKQILADYISDNEASSLDKAIAYKNLGTVTYRLGEDFKPSFEASEHLFLELLANDSSAAIQQEYAKMLFQRANCCIAACESDLSKAKLQGITVVPFSFIKEYISPAEDDLQKARRDYPASQGSDLLLISLELQLAKYHIWTITGQHEMAEKAGDEVLRVCGETLGQEMLASDVKVKLLLRYASALVEIGDRGKGGFRKALELVAEGMATSSGNAEIDSALVSLWGKLLLMSDASPEELASAEKRLVASTSSLEQLRSENVASMSFMARKEYFATRTGLYETLVELYARQNNPFAMLQAINRMRSRAIQDYVNNNAGDIEPETEEQLCQVLQGCKGMLVAYFITPDTVWIVTYTGNGGKVSHTHRSGQEIVWLATQTLNVFSNVQHLQGYMRFGSNYRSVPDAFAAANLLYHELLATAHEQFENDRLLHLYVLPHNILNYFPLGALVVQVNDDNALASRYIADTGLPIAYLPSLSAVMTPGVISLTANGSLVLARGTYSYPAYYNANPANPDDPSARPLNLPNVKAEGQAIARILKTGQRNCLDERDASEHNLLANTSEVPKSIVHVASHAHLDHNSPLDSYVVLAASHGEDGKVKVRELLTRYQGRMKVGLMVLSACDTNRGESNIQPGDDIAALSNAFLVAGVDNVIATQWPASDTSFPKIMALFYHRVQQHLTLDDALASAQKQFLAENQSAMRYPIFWANIVLIGKNQKK